MTRMKDVVVLNIVSVCARAPVSLQCSDAVGWATGRASIRAVKYSWCWFVGDVDLTVLYPPP